MTARAAATPLLHGLPDPRREPQFYAGVTAKRGLAWVIDSVITFGLSLLLVPFTAFTALFWFPVLWLVVGFAYRWATLSRGSATWGMRLMAITLRDRDGGPLEPSTAFAHVLGYSVSMAFLPLAVLSSAVMVALGRGQGLTDLALGTAVINRPA